MSACLIVKNIVAQTVFRYTEINDQESVQCEHQHRDSQTKKNKLFLAPFHSLLRSVHKLFSARQHICYSALRRYMPSPVRPSVCLSHGWISQRRLKLGSCNLHHRVAPWL